MSLFNLKTDEKQLSSINGGVSKIDYEQVTATREISGANFSGGKMKFRFETSGRKWWVPSKSYFRMRATLSDNGGNQIDLADNIAPNMNLVPNLFQSGECLINEKVVSRIPDFMPQVDTLDTRLTKSKAWIDSVGNSTNWWATSQALRQAQVSSDGKVQVSNSASVETQSSRTDLGFDGALANNNTAGYVAATGVITFSAGANANALPADVRVVFPTGSYFMYTAGTTVAASRGVRMKVITGLNGAGAGSATTIVVEPILPADENGAAGVANFVRIDVVDSTIDARRIQNFEMSWQPPFSLFKVDHALPSGKYDVIFTPQTASIIQKRAIESTLGIASKTAGAGNDFLFTVTDFYLYIATVEGPRADDITYLLDLSQTQCQAEDVPTATFHQKYFDVSPSTYALTVAYQDARVSENTAYSASKFRSYGNTATNSTPQELALNRFFINYAGQNLPAPDADPEFEAKIDYTVQRYIESAINSGGFFDTGGIEDIKEFHERGSYYTFVWPRDGSDGSTRVTVHQGFKAGTDVTNMRVLLFEHSKQIARVQVQNGRVVNVELEDK